MAAYEDANSGEGMVFVRKPSPLRQVDTNLRFIELLSLSELGGTHSKLVLEALGKVAWSGETDGIGHFGDGLVGSFQQLAPFDEPCGTQLFYGCLSRQCLYLSIELHATESHLRADVFDTQVAVGQLCLDHLAEAHKEGTLLRWNGRGGSLNSLP